jgi:membrane dipeptidase
MRGFRSRAAVGRVALRAVVGAGLALLSLRLAALPAQGAEPGARPFAVVDLHVDLPYQHHFEGRPFAEGTRQFRAADLARAGVVGAVLPLFVPRDASPSGPRRIDLESAYARVFGALASTEPYRLPGCLPRRGGVRTWLAFEGAGQLAGDDAALTSFAARGVRVVGPVHTESNALASSSRDAAPAYGLTAAGRDFVRAAQRLGMLLDVSHASDRATREILALSRESGAPVVATHSNARALADHPRNLRDPELDAIARSGGVVGVNFHSTFLAPGGKATLSDAVRQVRYLVRRIGSEHVALGADFEGDTRPPAELADVSGYQRLAGALLGAGMLEADVERIFSRNALRVLCRAGDTD